MYTHKIKINLYKGKIPVHETDEGMFRGKCLVCLELVAYSGRKWHALLCNRKNPSNSRCDN